MKSYTDLEQSKRLAEILPLESADMNWHEMPSIGLFARAFPYKHDDGATEGVFPCWSIAALMSVFPKEEGSCTSISFGYYDANGNHINSWLCCYEKEGESTDDYIIETIPADNPVDCCYKMILKLHEQNII